LDLDVLDPNALPAVTYPQPRGLDWHDLSALMAPLLASPLLAGVSVADYNPTVTPISATPAASSGSWPTSSPDGSDDRRSI
jgi:arginase family enzyme